MKHHLRVAALLGLPPLAAILQAGLNLTGYLADVISVEVERENHRLREQRRQEVAARRKPNDLPGWAQELHEVRKGE